jgi:hypothetical protein
VLQLSFDEEIFAFIGFVVFLNILIISAGENDQDNLQQQESDDENNSVSSSSSSLCLTVFFPCHFLT